MLDAALDGIKVLDLTHYVAGPYCTKLLADFGAEVIKIERPCSGDPARRMAPFFHDEPHPEKSLPFLYLNTSKRSVTLDITSETGKGILKRLVQETDVLVESFSPRALSSLGLGYESLREVNPGLVMVSISNFGQTGPYRDYKATDIVEYALGGMMYIFGRQEREPLKHALRQAQFKAGTNAASGAAIAVFHQQLTGQGQHVDVSIQESITSALRDTASSYTYMGAIKHRLPTYTGEMLREPVEVKGGHIVPIVYGAVNWGTMAEFLDAPELVQERFSTPEGRRANARELREIQVERFSQWEKLELFYAAHQKREFIFGMVQNPGEVLENPQYRERGYFVDIEHPVVGTATYPGAPFLMSQTPWNAQSPAPTLGQHNLEILKGRLGYSLEELGLLRATGVI